MQASGTTFERREKLAKHTVPIPNEDDYLRGYIQRYFARPSSNTQADIIEIDRAQFLSHQQIGTGLDSKLYKVSQLRWKLTGKAIDIQEANQKSVKSMELFMPNIGKKLNNLLQFAKVIE